MRTYRILLALLLCSLAAGGQTVSLSWTPSPSAAGNPQGSYNVYRSIGPCSAASASTWTKLSAMESAATGYADSAVSPLTTYCYSITFAVNGVESVQSTAVQVCFWSAGFGASCPLFPPSGLSVKVQ